MKVLKLCHRHLNKGKLEEDEKWLRSSQVPGSLFRINCINLSPPTLCSHLNTDMHIHTHRNVLDTLSNSVIMKLFIQEFFLLLFFFVFFFLLSSLF